MNHQDQERLLTDALERNAADLTLNQQPASAGTERLDISYSATDVPVEIIPATELPDDPQEAAALGAVHRGWTRPLST